VWRAFVPLVGRIVKALVIIIMGIAVLSAMGYPVASLIAGLGVGGLAVALAAQKTVENLFGSLSIAVDQPFRPGDFVKVEDFVGTVETVGLRSTRIRTLDRTVITLPNGKLADMRLETFATRDRMRLHAVLGLVYGTTAEQVRKVMRGIEDVLRAHPKIWPEALPVRFRALGAYALEIEVMCWFQTPDWNEFTLIRSEILLSFMDVVEKAGTAFAFPTQTLHVELDEEKARERASG
jgi:MscS family membrane protein